jgi:hypothetical protein
MSAELAAAIFFGGPVALLAGMVAWGVWSSYHCALCGKRLPWNSRDFFCENRGRCNFEILVRDTKAGKIRIFRSFWGA